MKSLKDFNYDKSIIYNNKDIFYFLNKLEIDTQHYESELLKLQNYMGYASTERWKFILNFVHKILKTYKKEKYIFYEITFNFSIEIYLYYE